MCCIGISDHTHTHTQSSRAATLLRLLDTDIKAIRPFETSETDPETQCHIPEELNLQQRRYKNLKFVSNYTTNESILECLVCFPLVREFCSIFSLQMCSILFLSVPFHPPFHLFLNCIPDLGKKMSLFCFNR